MGQAAPLPHFEIRCSQTHVQNGNPYAQSISLFLLFYLMQTYGKCPVKDDMKLISIQNVCFV